MTNPDHKGLFVSLEKKLGATFRKNETAPLHLLTGSKRLRCHPHKHTHTHMHTLFILVESDKTPDTKELRSLLTLAVSYGAVGTGAAHQYAKPQHQNKLCLPECSKPLCGLLLLYLSQPNTIHRGKLIASVGKVREDDTRLKDYHQMPGRKCLGPS